MISLKKLISLQHCYTGCYEKSKTKDKLLLLVIIGPLRLHLISKFFNVLRMRNASDLATFEHEAITNQLIAISPV